LRAPDTSGERSIPVLPAVRNYLSEAISKVGGQNRIEAARIARERGWLERAQNGRAAHGSPHVHADVHLEQAGFVCGWTSSCASSASTASTTRYVLDDLVRNLD